MKTQIPEYLSDFQARQVGIEIVNDLGLGVNHEENCKPFFLLPCGTAFSLEGIGRRFHRLIQNAIQSGQPG